MTRVERSNQRRLRRHARRAFQPAVLAQFCTSDNFDALGVRRDIAPGGWSTSKIGRSWWNEPLYYIHQDNGSNVLGVAHLDTVQGERSCNFVNTERGAIVRSPALDDRLGAYVICSLLPAMGVTVDWLLTTGEESAQSTAGQFTTDKPYNWVFSFDRAGTDVVLYEYETWENRERVSSVGAPFGLGSYSDICELEHLGVAGFNWGVGYRNYHSSKAWAALEDTFTSVARFVRFHDKYSGARIDHVPQPKWWESLDDELTDSWFEDIAAGICPLCTGLLDSTYCHDCRTEWSDDAGDLGQPYARRRAYEHSEDVWRELMEDRS